MTTAAPRRRSGSRAKRDAWDRRLMVLALVVLLGAWFYGYWASNGSASSLVPQVLPGATSIEQQGDLFIGRDAGGKVIGYAATGEAPGYGGPVTVLVGVTADGAISGVQLVTQRESPGFFRLVTGSGLFDAYGSRNAYDPLRLGEDLDAVSGATISAEGVASAVRVALREVTAKGLDAARLPERKRIKFGVPEVALILLFAAGYVGHRVRSGAWKRRIRWGTLLSGMVVLGFIYTAPLTITMIISLMSGYWPDWHNNLYWYLLLGGILFVTTVDAKNPYCYWFCPFGAVQECLAAVSGAGHYRPRDLARALQWVQRGIAVAAIGLGLALRRPGSASFEPFATLFDIRGGTVEWIFLALILLASLIIYRPFCNYLCPLDPVVDFIAAGRRWIKELAIKWRKRSTTA
ncbi:MAG: FMN-binding protein [Anaerolineae bacterium]|nr:FMN-binding protein [Anaerolineae bacterium]